MDFGLLCSCEISGFMKKTFLLLPSFDVNLSTVCVVRAVKAGGAGAGAMAGAITGEGLIGRAGT
jgi:hypothetical protein